MRSYAGKDLGVQDELGDLNSTTVSEIEILPKVSENPGDNLNRG